MSISPDKSSYEKLWKDVINVGILKYMDEFTGCIELIPNAKESIWEKYVWLNNYCKKNYMEPYVDKIDRHKIAACYLIAISSVKPMRLCLKDDEYNQHILLNEKLGIAVASSIISAYAISELENDNISDENKEKIKNAFEEDLQIPPSEFVRHGTYQDNYANEIHFAVAEGNINILSIANELFLLEVYTRMKIK